MKFKSRSTARAVPPVARSGRRDVARRAVAPPQEVEFEAVNHQELPFKADLEKLKLDKDTAKDLYRDMRLGRDFEDMCAQMYYRGKMFGFVHLYCGQEAVSTGVIRLLNKKDYVCRYAVALPAPAHYLPATQVMLLSCRASVLRDPCCAAAQLMRLASQNVRVAVTALLSLTPPFSQPAAAALHAGKKPQGHRIA